MVAEEEKEALTVRQAWVLKFLVCQGDGAAAQRDIEERFSIRRSTASHMLTLMENNGYIKRVPVPEDARMKHIVVTEKGLAAHERMADRLIRFEAMLQKGMTDEELAGFLVSRESDACTHCEFYNSDINRCYLDNPCVSELASVMLLDWLTSEKGICPGSPPGETVYTEN